jgi:hypothetical protein
LTGRPGGQGDSGLQRFAGYALAPNERGFCGPTDTRLLATGLRGGWGDEALGPLARAFTGPLPYLEVIADANGIADVFDPSVVEAYWVGNDLLRAVDPHVCADAVLAAFEGQPTVDPRRITATRDGASPTHVFHVLVTYPWIDLVAAGRTRALAMLDDCRVRWGTVERVQGPDVVVVRNRRLVVADGAIVLGELSSEVVRPVDRPGAPALRPGDLVTLHYDHLCDLVDATAIAQLQTRTAVTTELVNRCLLDA